MSRRGRLRYNNYMVIYGEKITITINRLKPVNGYRLLYFSEKYAIVIAVCQKGTQNEKDCNFYTMPDALDFYIMHPA